MRVPLSAAENDIEETFVWQLARRRRRRDVFRIRKAMSLLSENDESAGVSRNFEESSILSRNERPRGVFKFDTRLLKVICDSMAVRTFFKLSGASFHESRGKCIIWETFYQGENGKRDRVFRARKLRWNDNLKRRFSCREKQWNSGAVSILKGGRCIFSTKVLLENDNFVRWTFARHSASRWNFF